jgi:hypothetical protein
MEKPLRVQLEFEASEDPIAGTVTAGDERRPFTGWLGLIAGLEHAIGERQRRPEGNDEIARGIEGWDGSA